MFGLRCEMELQMLNKCIKFPVLTVVFSPKIITLNARFIQKLRFQKQRSIAPIMNLQEFCDEESIDWIDPLLPHLHLPLVSSYLPVSAHLFRVCDWGDRSIWSLAWELVGSKANFAMPSVASRRIRPSSALGEFRSQKSEFRKAL